MKPEGGHEADIPYNSGNSMALTPLGPYEIAAQIGEGGMGEVCRARDTRLKRDVALKTPSDSVVAHLQHQRQSAIGPKT